MIWRVRKIDERSELRHYGVKGMKWGVRKQYVPHPRKGNNIGSAKLKYTSLLREEVKAYAKLFGHTIAANIIPGYGMLYNINSMNNLLKQNSTKEYEKGSGNISELKKKKAETTLTQDVKSVNKTGKRGYLKNCFSCTLAFEMRRRGYDVRSLPTNLGANAGMYHDYFDGVKLKNSSVQRLPSESRKQWVTKNFDALKRDLERNGESARGFLSFTYEKGKVDYRPLSGHTINWVNESDGVHFYDSQSGKRDATELLSLSNQDYVWGRLDNCTVKNSVVERIESRGKK